MPFSVDPENAYEESQLLHERSIDDVLKRDTQFLMAEGKRRGLQTAIRVPGFSNTINKVLERFRGRLKWSYPRVRMNHVQRLVVSHGLAVVLNDPGVDRLVDIRSSDAYWDAESEGRVSGYLPQYRFSESPLYTPVKARWSQIYVGVNDYDDFIEFQNDFGFETWEAVTLVCAASIATCDKWLLQPGVGRDRRMSCVMLVTDFFRWANTQADRLQKITGWEPPKKDGFEHLFGGTAPVDFDPDEDTAEAADGEGEDQW